MLSISFTKEQFHNKNYIESSKKYHIFRDISSGFSTKWSGVWFENKKILDYYAFKINNIWPIPTKYEKHIGHSIHYYEISQNPHIEIKEKVIPSNKAFMSIITIKNKTNKKQKIDIEFEIAFDIRTKSETYHERNYITKIDHLRNMFTVFPEDDIDFKIYTGISNHYFHENIKSTIIEHKEQYRIHYPGEKERCYIPTTLKISAELKPSLKNKESELKIPFILTHNIHNYDYLSTNFEEEFHNRISSFTSTLLENEISLNNNILDNAYSWSLTSIKELNKSIDNLDSYFAGFPWFLEFWSRDILWSSLALLHTGEFKKVKNILKTLMKFYLWSEKDNQHKKLIKKLFGAKKGMIPSQILNSKLTYYNSDVNPLFLIILNRYAKFTGDYTLINKNFELIDDIIKSLEIKNKLVKPLKFGSWMDTLERDNYLIEIQSLWIEALKNQQLSITLKQGLDLFYNQNLNTYNDTPILRNKKEDLVTANVLVPLIFSQAPYSKASSTLNYVKENLMSPYGIKTLDKNHPKYKPDGYHLGSSWGLTTGWGASAFLNYNYLNEALNLLEIMAKEIYQNTIAGMNECVNSETGELIGCGSQLWSSAMYIYTIEEHLLGIKPNVLRKKLTITPKIPENTEYYRRNKKIGDSELDIYIKNKDKKITIELDLFEFDEDFVFHIILPNHIKSINYLHGEDIYNNKTINGNETHAKAKQKILIEAIQ